MNIQEILNTEWGSAIRSLNEEENLVSVIREWRTILLNDSDWTQLSDSPLSDQKRAEWKEYRQHLRDILEINATDLSSTVFPLPPQ